MTASKKDIQAACNHHSTLNAFGAVIALMEGGLTFDAESHTASQKIIRLCKAEVQRQLSKFDAAMTLATKGDNHATR